MDSQERSRDSAGRRNNNRGQGGGGGRTNSQTSAAGPGSSLRNAGRRGGNPSSQQQQQQQQQQPRRSNSQRQQPQRNRSTGGGGSSEGSGSAMMRDEDVLIAFMPFLKGNNVEAARIYEDYQQGRIDQHSFLNTARGFLENEKQQQPHPSTVAATVNSNDNTASAPSAAPVPSMAPAQQSLPSNESSMYPTTCSSSMPMTSNSQPHQPHPPPQPLHDSQNGSTLAQQPPPPHLGRQISPELLFRNSLPSNTNGEPSSLSQQHRPDPPGASHTHEAGSSTNHHAQHQQHQHNPQVSAVQMQQPLPPTPERGGGHQFFAAATGGPAAPEPYLSAASNNISHHSSFNSIQMSSIEKGLDALLDDDPIVPMPQGGGGSSSIWGVGGGAGAAGGGGSMPGSPLHAPITTPRQVPNAPGMPLPGHHPQQQPHHLQQPQLQQQQQGLPHPYHQHTPPRQQLQQHQPPMIDHNSPWKNVVQQQHPQQQQLQQSMPPPIGSPQRVQTNTNGGPSLLLPPQRQPQPQQPMQQTPTTAAASVTVSGDTMTPQRPASALGANPTTTKKDAPPPKRVWTHFEQQPGRILVNGVSGEDNSVVLSLGPREELTAHWSLPIAYLRTHAAAKLGPRGVALNKNLAALDAIHQQSTSPQVQQQHQQQQQPAGGGMPSLETVLSSLTLGLFRRGCTENGMQASIVSKGVLGDFWKDPATDTVRGKVPFFSPRTPGHVVFRLYWDEEPIYTLAMGPALLVRVMEPDFESSVRFILSNFKGKKSNPTSLSSLHSLAVILETQLTRPNESAARATWGCIQEARKVLDACASDYEKTSSKLSSLEESVEELKKQVESEETHSQDLDHLLEGESHDDADENVPSEAAAALREKTRTLMSGRASCERKWRDSQLAFASILRAVVTNPTMSILLRRDLITKMRIEFELWCPLSEEFAIPSETARMWYEPLNSLPQTITAEDFRLYTQSRVKMQLRTLGFDPSTFSLEDVLFPRNRGSPNQRSMDPGAVGVFNNVSAAMGQFFQGLYKDEEFVGRRRELIRLRTEQCVQQCGAFPVGTRVAIFGSSANGFGSPLSDLDMCLQLPGGIKIGGENFAGAESMAKLAAFFETSGMSDVDTARLTARIPVIRFHCPNPLRAGNDDDELIECDLSMHNPLAVLNTALFRTYAEITPVTRVLAAIIKRWAKARDINNPARHTLSSYGYIIMLVHFLTYHKRTGNGLVSPVAPPEGDPSHRNPTVQRPTPLLPNLQWVDPSWPNQPRGTPYRDLNSNSRPRHMMQHPREEDKTVNAYFYKPRTPNDTTVLQMHFPGQDLSLAILLASFFRYYAYEFDYKRYVVSLHSTSARGLVEREVKAELEGWRNYSAALTIEDPFETFYDVAHVLRGGYYHRIRREFAVAYTKIADAASGRQGSWNKGDLRAMSGQELIDWICEPIEKEREEGNTHEQHNS